MILKFCSARVKCHINTLLGFEIRLENVGNALVVAVTCNQCIDCVCVCVVIVGHVRRKKTSFRPYIRKFRSSALLLPLPPPAFLLVAPNSSSIAEKCSDCCYFVSVVHAVLSLSCNSVAFARRLYCKRFLSCRLKQSHHRQSQTLRTRAATQQRLLVQHERMRRQQ